MMMLARVFRVTLAAWLAVGGVMPTCCWSMLMPLTAQASPASATVVPPAHHHEPAQAVPHSHHQAHAGTSPVSNEEVSPPAESTSLAAAPQGCDSGRDVAIAAADTASSLRGVRAGHSARLPDRLQSCTHASSALAAALVSPGASTSRSAFISPLRI